MVSEQPLAEIVGRENVLDDEAGLVDYARDTSFENPIRPRCIVKPRSADEVQRLVKWANDTLTPLVPVSSGHPHFHGDTVPGTGGAVVVDLSGMKRIIRVDRRDRVAMVEPGVPFGELIPALASEGLRPNMPLLPRSTKSVVGSMLSREPVVMPKYHWDIADPLACVEVVFGGGEIFRTGAAAGPGTIEEQWSAGGSQKEAGGPGPVSWHRIIQGAQGTMGIVAWASLRCELQPSIETPFLVGSPDLSKLLDLARWLVRLRLVNECLVLNNTNLSATMASSRGRGLEDLRKTLPPWALFFNIAGYEYLPEKRVSSQTKDMADIAQRIGLEPGEAVGRVSAEEYLRVIQKPSAEPYWKCYKGSCEDVFFLAKYGDVGGLIAAAREAANEAGYPATEIGIYLQPIVQGTNCHCEFNLFYDPRDQRETDRARKLSLGLTKDLMARGAFFSRPHGPSTSMVMNRQADSISILRKVRSILDPNNIMNPSKLCF